MRIIGGAFRGRVLIAPPGSNTRPTSDRVRQALFDMLSHAAWGGRDLLDGTAVLDAFAGTGAFGLEAISRGAAHATFVENDKAALAALRTNIATCRAVERATICACDALAVRENPPPVQLAFLDPPYGRDLVPRAVTQLRMKGWLTSRTLIVAEVGRDELVALPNSELLAERCHGAARITFWRA